MFVFVVYADEPEMAAAPKMNAAFSRERERERERGGAVFAAFSDWSFPC